MKTLELLSPTSESWKSVLFLLPLVLGHRCEPSADQLLRAEALHYLAAKPGLEVSPLIEIPKPAEPKLPGFHVARRNANPNAVPVFVIKARVSDGLLDFFMPMIEAGIVGINDYQQAYGLTGTLAEVLPRPS
jgi:hypothetical protein